jgi:hypothetical protein
MMLEEDRTGLADAEAGVERIERRRLREAPERSLVVDEAVYARVDRAVFHDEVMVVARVRRGYPGERDRRGQRQHRSQQAAGSVHEHLQGE